MSTDTLTQIKTAIGTGDTNTARHLLRDQLKQEPNADLYYYASQVALDNEQKVEFLEKAIALDPFHTEAQAQFKALTQTFDDADFGRLETAREVMERALYNKKPYEANPQAYDLATFWARLLAYIIDYIVVLVLQLASGFLLGLAVGPFLQTSEQLATLQSFAIIISLVVITGYYTVGLVQGNGQTLGKRLMKIRVIRMEGDKLTIGHAILRNIIGYLLSAIFLVIGFLWVFTDKDKQAWHDKLVSTVVVQE